jgi:Na+/H+ antiporter NhaD/arsenite permease-like protein
VTWLPDIFSLIVAAAGWYYIFYSRAAQRLSGIEDSQLNTFRIRLRRLNGVVMMLLAVAFFASMHTVTKPGAAAWVFMLIMLLLAAMMILALIDVNLTRRLRARRKKDQQ